VDTLKWFIALTLTAMLLSACGGSGGRTKVKANLRDYLSTIDPLACLESHFCPEGVFPVGAGIPRVRENSCKNLGTFHTDPARVPKGLPRPVAATRRFRESQRGCPARRDYVAGLRRPNAK
jgi:hypothetical protein